MNFSILGTGRMAGKVMDTTIAEMVDVQAYAVVSRSSERAREFAAQHGFAKAYGSYEELIALSEEKHLLLAEAIRTRGLLRQRNGGQRPKAFRSVGR